MPGTCCSVIGCGNQGLKTKKTPGKEHIMYHKFPANEKIRQQWMERSWKPGFTPDTYGKRVCSEHFREDDYVRDLQAELLGLPPKRRLKKTAIPSLKMPPRPPNADKSNERVRKQDLKKLSESFLHDWAADEELVELEPSDSEKREDPMELARTMTLAEIKEKFYSQKKPKPMFEVPKQSVNVIDPRTISQESDTSSFCECDEEMEEDSVGSAPKRAKSTSKASAMDGRNKEPTATKKTGSESAPLPQGNLTVILPPKETMSGRSLCCWLEAERARLLEEEVKQLKKKVSELESKESAQSEKIEELTETNRQLKEVLFNVKGVRLASRGAGSSAVPQVQTVKLAEPNVMLVVVDI